MPWGQLIQPNVNVSCSFQLGLRRFSLLSRSISCRLVRFSELFDLVEVYGWNCWWKLTFQDVLPSGLQPGAVAAGPRGCHQNAFGSLASPRVGRVKQALSSGRRQNCLPFNSSPGYTNHDGIKVIRRFGLADPSAQAAVKSAAIYPLDWGGVGEELVGAGIAAEPLRSRVNCVPQSAILFSDYRFMRRLAWIFWVILAAATAV